jgi:serine/threonine protein phosphatase PrpC
MGCSTSQIAASTESAPKHLDKAQNKPNVVQDTKADSEAASASIRFAAVSEPGWTTSHAKINQDVVLAVPDLTEDISLFAVFDGHGQFGHQVAAFVAGALPKALLAQGPELLKSDTTTVIRQASRTVESALRRSGLKTAYSGTTATWAIVNHEEKTVSLLSLDCELILS